MATNVELDPTFCQALQHLHSSQTDAAENIRKALDEVIKQKHGPSKMLINTLSKKYIAEESNATGSGIIKHISSARRSSNKSSDSSSNNSNSSPIQIIATTTTPSTSTSVLATDLTGQRQEIPVIISIPDSDGSSITAVDDNAMDTNIHNSLFEDLACVICHRIDLSAKNRLIECTKCNSLYHQECHNPQIKDLDLANGQESAWLCVECKGGSSTTSVSSSSSGSSKEKKEKEHGSSSSKSKSSSLRHHSSHHSSSHHSSKHDRSSGSDKSGSSKTSAPHPKTKILSRSEKSKSSKSRSTRRLEE